MWTNSLDIQSSLNQEEIAALELNLQEKLVEFEKEYDEELLKVARKYKINIINELQKTLKSARDAWAGVKHYENKVSNLTKKLNRLHETSRPGVEAMEDKLDRK